MATVIAGGGTSSNGTGANVSASKSRGWSPRTLLAISLPFSLAETDGIQAVPDRPSDSPTSRTPESAPARVRVAPRFSQAWVDSLGPDAFDGEEQARRDVLVQNPLSAGASGVGKIGSLLCAVSLAGGQVPLTCGQVALAVGPVSRAHGDQPGDQRQDQQDADTNERAAQAPVDPALLREPRFGRAYLARLEGDGRVEEGRFGLVQVWVGAVAPLGGAGETGAPVELALRAAHRVPGVCGTGQVPEDALPVDVVVEPAAQPGPNSDQRLVGDLDGVPVDAHQPCFDELLNEPLVLVIGGNLRARHPRPHRVAVLAGHHQAQQERA